MKIITGETALARNSLTTIGSGNPRVLTDNLFLDGVNNMKYRYVYCDEVDAEHYVNPITEELLLPTAERAIVDYIRMEWIRDEGTLLWAIQDYLDDKELCNIPKLYEVAEFYGLSQETINYWIKETIDYDYYGSKAT